VLTFFFLISRGEYLDNYQQKAMQYLRRLKSGSQLPILNASSQPVTT